MVEVNVLDNWIIDNALKEYLAKMPQNRKKMNYPNQKGQSFGTLLDAERFTALSFFGATGVEYDTLQEAMETNNVTSEIIKVKNFEYGGSTFIKDCTE